jgi:hypothetical protein
MSEKLVFKPRPSHGALWIGGLGAALLALAVGPSLVMVANNPATLGSALPGLLIGGVLGTGALVMAAWIPSMRYEIDDEFLTLTYGPMIKYRIHLEDIRGARRRNLMPSIMSSMRFPGLAVGSVPYADAGTLYMCSTAAARGVLLVETEARTYGITPADEAAFVKALMERVKAAGGKIEAAGG